MGESASHPIQLARWKHLTQVLLAAQARIVRALPHDLDGEITRALGSIGLEVGLDRAMIVHYIEELHLTRVSHEWRRNSLVTESFRDLPVAALPRLVEPLLIRQEPVSIGDFQVLDDTWAPEKRFAWHKAMRSAFYFPVSFADGQKGYFSFERCTRAREWNDERVFLGHVADTIGAALDRRQMFEQLAQREHQLRRFLDHSLDIIVRADDTTDLVTFVSPAIKTILDRDPDDVVGLHFADLVHPEDRRFFVERVDDEYTGEIRALHRDGTWVWVEISVRIRRDEPGGAVESYVTLRDITQRKGAEHRLERQETFDRLLLDLSTRFLDFGAEILDVELQRATAEIGALLGVAIATLWASPGEGHEVTCLTEWAANSDDRIADAIAIRHLAPNFVHALHRGELVEVSADRPVPASFDEERQLLDSAGVTALLIVPLMVGERFTGSFVLVAKRHPRRWTAQEHTLMRMVAEMFANALEMRNRNRALLQSEARFRLLAARSNDLIVRFGRDGILRYVSPAAERLLGHDSQDMTGRSLLQYLDPDLRAAVGGELAQTFAPKPRIIELKAVHVSGITVWLEASMQPIFDEQGRFEEFQAALRDISDRKRKEDSLARQATHDPLTDLPNRRFFFEHLGTAILSLQRRAGLVAVLFCDLDGFKEVNDSFGHARGDELLATAAARMRDVVRSADLVARHGGDEFAVLLPWVASAQEAEAAAERIVRALSVSFEIDGVAVRIGASVGIAFESDHQGAAATLLRRADEAMYAAKLAGKNCWMAAGRE